MSFFNSSTDTSGKQSLSVVPQIWWYPAAAIPLTLLVLLIWRLWLQKRLGKHPRTAPDVSERLQNMQTQVDQSKRLFTGKDERHGLDAQATDGSATLRRRQFGLGNLFNKKEKTAILLNSEARGVP